MYSRCSGSAALVLSLALLGAARPPHPLRVCADPNNLPFSNRRGQGFENRIAELLARDLGARVEYTWWAQRRGFIRNTLKAGSCDVIMGVPAGLDMVARTAPYYRSGYVFVTRHDRRLGLHSLDDPALRKLTIGVQLIGDDGVNTPPAHALTRRGIIANVRGYTVYGDYAEESPPRRIIEAVARGEIDVALAWGPMAGYWARRSQTPLDIVPIEPRPDRPRLPFTFAIAIGVRRSDSTLRATLDSLLHARRAEIDRILDSYGVPRVAAASPEAAP
jgi:mxaJ protein